MIHNFIWFEKFRVRLLNSPQEGRLSITKIFFLNWASTTGRVHDLSAAYLGLIQNTTYGSHEPTSKWFLEYRARSNPWEPLGVIPPPKPKLNFLFLLFCFGGCLICGFWSTSVGALGLLLGLCDHSWWAQECQGTHPAWSRAR